MVIAEILETAYELGVEAPTQAIELLRDPLKRRWMKKWQKQNEYNPVPNAQYKYQLDDSITKLNDGLKDETRKDKRENRFYFELATGVALTVSFFLSPAIALTFIEAYATAAGLTTLNLLNDVPKVVRLRRERDRQVRRQNRLPVGPGSQAADLGNQIGGFLGIGLDMGQAALKGVGGWLRRRRG